MNKKCIFCFGSDGYIGYSLSVSLYKKGYRVIGIDNYSRRDCVAREGSCSIIPIDDRKVDWETLTLDICKYEELKNVLQIYQPDAIFHLAENPSAPYSMKNAKCAMLVQQNNILGTLSLIFAVKEVCPNIPIIKIGTSGEYSDWIYDNSFIPESSRVKVIHDNKEILIPVPRYAGSWYHFSKIYDSMNLDFASKVYGLSVTDVNQGPVYGVSIPEFDNNYKTRFDIDESFGTVINRFVAQAIIGMPLTIYGQGGQTRAYLSLKDSIQCLNLILENPPIKGEFRIVNQFENTYSINYLAQIVMEIGNNFGLDVKIDHIKNPRVEREKHKYNVKRVLLDKWGYIPTSDIKKELSEMFEILIPYRDRIKDQKNHIKPIISWKE